MKFWDKVKNSVKEGITKVKRVWAWLRSNKLQDWFCNPCDWPEAPVRIILEVIVPEQTRKCWCCSHIRGLFYGFLIGVTATIVVYQLIL